MNIEKIRDDIVDIDKKTFLDSAGSSLMPKSVVEKINKYLEEEQLLGGYTVSDINKNQIEEFYKETAQLLNTQSRNIAFTHDATDAYTKALSSISFKPNDVIVTSDDDYGSNQIQFISLQKRYGILIQRIKNHENGDLDIEHFQQLLERLKPKLVAITHVPTNSGMVQHVEKIGEICSSNNIMYLVDACQSIGQLNVDVSNIKCDFLSATGRKFLRGPRGTGFLYVSDKVLDSERHPLFIDGQGAKWTKENAYEIERSAKRFETLEKPYALKVGLVEALKYLNKLDIKKVEEYNKKLMSHFRSELSTLQDVLVFDKGTVKCNILTFTKKSKSLDDMTLHLNNNSVIHSVSHKRWGIIDFNKKGVDWLIRLSPHYFNTTDEIDKVIQVIDQM